MCGIAGVFNFQKSFRVSLKVLENMLLSLNHRGPDERGIYLQSNIGLASARLSIIDLVTGQQPMSDNSGNYWIVFNGEIFNYIELRKDIESTGYHFRTKSDTEIIVALYSLYGSKFVSMLNGQFAFAIWDKRKQELFLARDRSGICPLYYTTNNGSFIFGSEIKAIFQYPGIISEISIPILCQLVTYWTALTPATLFNNIHELTPGHFMRVSVHTIHVEPYWTLSFSEEKSVSQMPIPEAIEELEAILKDAVRMRLRSDVPIASYLSGGIDSTTTTSLIKNLLPDVLNTFSIGFVDHVFDETTYQSEASNYLKTIHKSIKCQNHDITRDYSKIVWHAETPMLRTAPAPMYNLSALVRKNNIKVVITGEGADELLGGYDIFKEMLIRRFWARMPNSRLRPLLLKKLYPSIPQISSSIGPSLKMFYGFKLDQVHLPMYSHLLRWNNGFHILKFLHPAHRKIVNNFNPYEQWLSKMPHGFNEWNHLAKAQYLEFTLFMSGYLLSAQGDRMTMANSVEGRYPFLDNRFIEFATRLPENYKIHGLNEKYLLKRMMKNKIPDSILKRPKQPYRAPGSDIFFHETRYDIESVLNSHSILKYEIFDPVLVSNLIEKIKATGHVTEIENMIITTVISTQLLCRLFIDREGFKSIIPANNTLRVIEEINV